MALLHFAAGILLHLALELSCGVQAQSVQVLQTLEIIAVAAGESAAFSCTVTVNGGFVIGPVRWYKGSEESRTLIYSEKRDDGPFPRVSPVSLYSNTDVSIRVTNVSTEDAGTYYCVKLDKSTAKEYTSSRGTFLSVRGVQAQTVHVSQFPKTVAVTAGESAIFSCTVTATDGFVNGPVRWFKGSGGSRTLIYTDKQEERPFPRVFRVSPVSIMDFSINITNVSTQDAGTYYCVKFKKIFFKEIEHASATGTSLSVSGVQTQTIEVLQSPETIIIAAGESATFSCTITVTSGFVIGPVRWFKGSGESRTLIYSEKLSESPYPRVSRVSPDSNTDMSIRITNVSTGDKGTYYCVKFNRASSHEEEQRSGPGTVLSVREEAPGSSGVYISSQTLWIGFVVEKLCLMAFVLGCIYLKQRF